MSSLRSKFRKRMAKKEEQKPYIVPTLFGLWFLFLVVDIFALGYFRDNSPFHTVGLTLIIFGWVAMIHTNTNLQSLDLKVDRCELGQAYATSEVQISLLNTSGLPSHNLEVQVDKPFALKDALHITELGSSETFRITVKCPKRGVYPLVRVKVFSRGVYGLFYTWKWQKTAAELVVYPSPKAAYALPHGSEGAGRSSPNSEDFAGHRRFVVGDSLKHIDWKAYARGSDLLIKDFADQAMEALELKWEDTHGDTEERLEQLTSWILHMNSLQRPFSLHLPTETIGKNLGETHTKQALRAIALYEDS